MYDCQGQSDCLWQPALDLAAGKSSQAGRTVD